MVYALNDPLASFVFIYCIIVWKCILLVRIKIYIYIYIYITLQYTHVFLAASKAFDRVNHRTLFTKLINSDISLLNCSYSCILVPNATIVH